MKLILLLFLITIVIIVLIVLIIGSINYYKNKKENKIIFFFDEVLDATENVFCELLAPFYLGIIIIGAIIFMGLSLNLKAYAPIDEVKEEIIILDKMAIHNNQYVYKTDINGYEYLPAGKGDIEYIPDYMYENIKFYTNKDENYLVIKYKNYKKDIELPDWIIDSWANKEREKYIISYNFYTE